MLRSAFTSRLFSFVAGGGIGLGLYDGVEAVSKFMRPAGETRPIPENHAQYLALIPHFEAVYQALKTVYDK